VTTRPGAAPTDVVGDVTRMKALLGPPQVTFGEGADDLCR
jgi:hypothetical protein